MSPSFRIDLERSRYVIGETVRGAVLVLEGGRSRRLGVSLELLEISGDDDFVATSRTVVGPILHKGNLREGDAYRFAVRLPEDGPPSYTSTHGRLAWLIDVHSDELGGDTNEYEGIWVDLHEEIVAGAVQPGSVAPKRTADQPELVTKLVSPSFERVPDESPLATWPRRAGALLVDWMAITAVWFVAFTCFFGLSGTDSTVAMILLFYASAVACSTFWLSRSGERNGQTPGKRLLRIRVIRQNRAAFSLPSALRRDGLTKWMLFGGAAILLVIPSVLNFLWPVWDRENRALHDLISSTRVVED